MKTAVVSVTRNGAELALKVGRKMKADIYVKNEFVEKYVFTDEMFFVHPVTTDFSAFVGLLFRDYKALVFVMACGIVVRAIAPYIRNKAEDPAIVVADEKGQYVISLLSGHIGGANKLAKDVAAITGGVPVITTATDVNGVVAFDVFAAENDCVIENLKDLKFISSELVNGRRVSLYSDFRMNGELPKYVVPYAMNSKRRYAVVLSNRTDVVAEAEKILYIRPRNLILGIGCRKGTSKEDIRCAVDDFMKRNKKSILSVKTVASIDLKKEEGGIISFCSENGLEFKTISGEIIKSIENNFTFSSFVKEKVGVGGVAEACAVTGGCDARLVCPKTVYKGITLALAEEERVFYI